MIFNVIIIITMIMMMMTWFHQDSESSEQHSHDVELQAFSLLVEAQVFAI